MVKNNMLKKGPNMTQLKDMAKQLKITGYSKLPKTDLIHAIQKAEGNADCYERISDCTLEDCLFFAPCQQA